MNDDEEHTKRILGFLAGEFSKQKERAAVSVTLKPDQGGGGGGDQHQLLHREREECPEVFDISSSTGPLEEFVSEILRVARTYADSFGPVPIRFELRVRQYMNASVKYAFRLLGASDGSGDGSEPPTEKGFVGQVMRYNEGLMRTSIGMFHTTYGTMQQTIIELTTEKAKLAGELAFLHQRVKELESSESEVMLRVSAQESADARKKQVLDVFLPFLPVAASKLLADGGINISGGTTGGGGTEHPAILIIREFGKTLEQDPTQIGKLMPLLRPEQRMLLVNMLQLAEKKPEQPPSAAPNG